ncbi:hypothetical protein [Teredinibacter waterburyi]|uniref:hypothetical protein n=1 Tax=Teredinibacter waterburyi TaxID=1500538 RepID=UPI00165F1931|nr:hypothetical protein [Teredinibacter waterburyi]
MIQYPRLDQASNEIVDLEAHRILSRFRGSHGGHINLAINTLDFRPFMDSEIQPAFEGPVSKLLVKEVSLWSKMIGRKSVRQLLLSHPFALLEPYQLTEVMHALASHFSLSEAADRRYVAASNIREIGSQHIALLKGLGFNHYQLITDYRDLAEMSLIRNAMRQIRQFAFRSVSIQVRDADCLDDLRGHIQELTRECSPSFIFVGNRPKLLNIDPAQQEPGTIIFDGEDDVTDNTLTLGLEEKSFFDGLEIENFCDPQRYLNALESGRLPIHPFHHQR